MEHKKYKLGQISYSLNYFQKLLVNISHLQLTSGTTSDLTIHLNKILDGNKDLNSPRKLIVES